MMSFRNRNSVNGVVIGLIAILIILLVLGIVTGKIIYILMGVILFLVIIGIIAFFNFLKKTGEVSSKTRKSTYDILKSNEIEDNLETKWEQNADSVTPKSSKGSRFCEFCGMKLDPGIKFCPNCGKENK